MKRLIALLLAAVICLSLVACGGGETPNTDDSNAQGQQAQNGNKKPEITDPNVSEPQSTEPMETTNQTENLEEVRKAELSEILCGGKWVYAFDDTNLPSDYPIEMHFFEDGTMKYIDGAGEEHNANLWSFMQYTVNWEIEGLPGAAVCPPMQAIEYASERGVYYFTCNELYYQEMPVGYSADGEYIIHINQFPYKKVAEAN